MDPMLWFIIVPLYSVMMGIMFRVRAARSSKSNPWDDATVFFGSLFWPIGLSAMMGAFIAKTVEPGATNNRLERKRQREMADAHHKLQLARVEAQTIRELERSNGMV